MSHPAARLATLALAVAAFGSAAQAANLLANASFESPGCSGNCILGGGSTFITGWTTINSGVEYFQANLYGGTAPDGLMIVDLANYTYSSGGIEQSFATVAGEKYTLNFFAGNTKSSGRVGEADIRVQVGDLDIVVATAVATDAAYAWRSVTLDFTALGASTTLSFSNSQDANTHFAFIDAAGVEIAAVPEPGTWALLLAGLALTSAAASRRQHRA